MSKLTVRRLIFIILLPIAVWGIMWCCIKIVEPFGRPSGLSEREFVEYSPYLIGKQIRFPLDNFQIGCNPSECHFGTDAGIDELIDLIKMQPHVIDVAALGRWNDGSDRYLIRTQCRGGAAYLELIDLRQSVDMGQWYHPFRSKHSYILVDCSMTATKNEEYYDILFPQIRRNKSGEELLSGEALEIEQFYAMQKPENSSGQSLFDFFLQFYDDSALYRVLDYTDSEITVTFNQKALDNNPSTGAEQSFDLEYIYKGMFKISVDEAKQAAAVTILDEQKGA